MRNRASPRNDGNAIAAAAAAAKIRDDSIAGNQAVARCPDSCQIMSGRVLPSTAAQAMMRGHGLDVAGLVGFICLADNRRRGYDTGKSAALNLSSSGISSANSRNDSI